MKRMILAVLAAALLGVAAPGISAVAAENDKPQEGQKEEKGLTVAEGDYAVEGTQAGGKQKYQGMVNIKKKGDTYQVQWQIGRSVYRGLGIVDGDRLCVSCVMGGQPCIVVYKIEKDKTLRGRWSVAPGSVEIEVLTYQAPLV